MPTPRYMVADITFHMDVRTVSNPFQPHVPFHIGVGPEVPSGTFVHNGEDYQVHFVLDPDPGRSVFSAPVVVASRIPAD